MFPSIWEAKHSNVANIVVFLMFECCIFSSADPGIRVNDIFHSLPVPSTQHAIAQPPSGPAYAVAAGAQQNSSSSQGDTDITLLPWPLWSLPLGLFKSFPCCLSDFSEKERALCKITMALLLSKIKTPVQYGCLRAALRKLVVVNSTHTEDEDLVYLIPRCFPPVWFDLVQQMTHLKKERGERKKEIEKKRLKFHIYGEWWARPCVITRHSTCKCNENTPTLISPIGVLYLATSFHPHSPKVTYMKWVATPKGCLWVEAALSRCTAFKGVFGDKSDFYRKTFYYTVTLADVLSNEIVILGKRKGFKYASPVETMTKSGMILFLF